MPGLNATIRSEKFVITFLKTWIHEFKCFACAEKSSHPRRENSNSSSHFTFFSVTIGIVEYGKVNAV